MFVCLCACACVHVCSCVCACVYVPMCVRARAWACTCVCACVRVCVCACVCACAVCVWVHMHVNMRVHVHECLRRCMHVPMYGMLAPIHDLHERARCPIAIKAVLRYRRPPSRLVLHLIIIAQRASSYAYHHSRNNAKRWSHQLGRSV